MFASNDFEKMGLGIEARYRRCQQWWDPHLRCTRQFVACHVPVSADVLVLGAGRLLDIDLTALLKTCERVHLCDADPRCIDVWRRTAGRDFGKRVLAYETDCTEILSEWSRGLGAAKRGNLSNFLRGCKAPVPKWAAQSYQGIISLNILGQIPLYWRDRVLAAVPRLTDEEWNSLVLSMEDLQIAHLEGIKTRREAWSILISDTEYYFYESDNSCWRVENALFGGVQQRVHETYRADRCSDCWFWHVSPQYIECDDEGEIHRVEAFYRASVLSADGL